MDPPGLIRDATSSTLNKSSLAVNPRTLSSPARRASQDSSTPAIQLGLPPLLRPAIVLPRRPPGAPPHPSCQQPCCVLSTDGTAHCSPAAACPEPECGSWLVSNAVSVEVLYCCCCDSPILGSRPIFSCPDCSYDACVACSLPPKRFGFLIIQQHRSRNAAACSPSPAGSGRGARVKSAKLGSPPRDIPRSWTCSSRELTVRGSVDSPVGEIPWFLCASAEELHARGPLPVKEIAIYYDRWEGEGFALFSPRYG